MEIAHLSQRIKTHPENKTLLQILADIIPKPNQYPTQQFLPTKEILHRILQPKVP
jgi:hypothetical protein